MSLLNTVLNTNPPYNFEEGACLLIDKPLGLTSFDVVHKVRGAIKKSLKLKDIKVGHAGTLDPLATGLLLICTGKYTKRIDELMGQDKAYTGTLRLGETTPSVDGESAVDATFATQHITADLLAEATLPFVGNISQRPPIFSAIKKDGKRAYESARAGEVIEMEARPVHISEFALTEVNMPDVQFRVVCSKGTYIRSLVRDFGQALHSGAWMTALRRTKIGEYSIEAAWQLDDLLARIAKL
jgi:tRNA pseudouridine55 synthase